MRALPRTTVVALTLLLPLLGAAQAQAEKVTSLVPWKATNTYVSKADIDGRAAPTLEPRAFINAVRKGQEVRITCQVEGELAFGSRIWDKVGDYYVPDQLLKTYTDGRLQGAPTCGAATPAPSAPAPAAPKPPRCEAFTVYGVRGSGESLKGNHGMGATVGPTATVVKRLLRGRTVKLVGLAYPASPVSTLIQDPATFKESMDVGEVVLRGLIMQRIASCPKTRIAVIGYSQGAGVVSEALRGLPTRAFKRVRVAVLFADTYSAGESSYSLSSSYLNPARTTLPERQGHGIFGAKRLPAALHEKLDLCFVEDLVCNGSSSTGKTAIQAALVKSHSHYKDWTPTSGLSQVSLAAEVVKTRIRE